MAVVAAAVLPVPEDSVPLGMRMTRNNKAFKMLRHHS